MKNQLTHASSPYLRQHANNPVHWQKWNAATLVHAKKTDTPILLSIGYSACHWCHVMAHECFEDAALADAMNASFVNIKLDREERPDLDRVYQLAHQALSGRGGGWPLTVFLDPQDLTPFFIGTYFPPVTRHGLPAFTDVLQRVRDFYDTQRDGLREQNAQLRNWLARASESAAGDVPSPVIIDTALQRIAAHFDPQNGGLQGAPKFPHAGELELLLDCAIKKPLPHQGGGENDSAITSEDCAAMAYLSLQHMAARGLQDHLGGGFFRYCVDAQWTIPHFEKMLYDNAQLLPVYARAAAGFGDAAFAQAAHGIVEWLQREMTSKDNAFFSALDADSEGAEGRLDEGAFYIWTREQLRAVLNDGEYAAAESGYGLDAPPNFEHHAWHLFKARTLEQIATRLDREPYIVQQLLASAREKLFAARAQRVRPVIDDKRLTAWNALTISGLLRAARALDSPEFAKLAFKVLDALHEDAWINDALYANSETTSARIPGFLDDHALLLEALLESLQQRWNKANLQWAIALADALLERFEDPHGGGFFFSAEQHDTPIARSRSFTDDSLPNGNGVAARALLRLGHLLGETRYLDAAERTLRAANESLQKYPDACATLLRALREYHSPPMQIVVRCAVKSEKEWRDAIDDALAKNHVDRDSVDVFVIPSSAKSLPGLLAERKSRRGGVAYVCEGTSCRAPILASQQLTQALHA